MSQYASETVGDNIEFTASSIDTYTITFNQAGTDTETSKFSENRQTARKFIIRTNKNVDLLRINSTTFTDPITIIADKAHTEKRNVPVINKIQIRTTATNTTIKVRWF